MKIIKIVFLGLVFLEARSLYAAQEVLSHPSNFLPELPVSDLKRENASLPSSSPGQHSQGTSTDFLMAGNSLSVSATTAMNRDETGDEYNGSQSNVTFYPDKRKELFQGVWSNSNPGFDEEKTGLREMRDQWTSTDYDSKGNVLNKFVFEDHTIDRKENNEILYHEHAYWVDGMKEYEEKFGKEKNDFGQVIREYDWREMKGVPRIGYEYQITHDNNVPVEIIYTQWAGEKGSFVIHQVWEDLEDSLAAQIKTTIRIYDRFGKLTSQDEKIKLSSSRFFQGVSLEEILLED